MVQDGLINYCYFKSQSEAISHCIENGFDEYLLLATEVFEERYKKYFSSFVVLFFQKIKHFINFKGKFGLYNGLNN